MALSNSNRPVELIDLGKLHLDELHLEDESGKLEIGATTKIQQLVELDELQDFAGGYLANNLEKVGSYPIRNAGTLGGSIVRPFPWSDVVPILLSLGAKIRYFDGTHGVRDLNNLYSDDFRETLRNSIVTGIEVDLPEVGETRGRFYKFSRSEFDIASLNLGCTLTALNGKITRARMAVGARPSFARRLTEVEDFLQGQSLENDLAEEATEMAADTAGVTGDRKMSKDYRLAQVRKMTEEALTGVIGDFLEQ